jgi:uncharacterized membrane protein YdjX (TVP38/TMEM64 family)
MSGLKKLWSVMILLICMTAMGLCIVGQGGFADCRAFLENKDTHAAVFIVMMSVLPIIGFPIYIFLILVGAKFGLILGLFWTAATMALHLSVTFLIAHSILGPLVKKVLRRFDFQTDNFSQKQRLITFVLFTAIPGPPYAVKNYTLSFSGISFIEYLLLSWTIHLVMAVPLIAFGHYSVEIDIVMTLAFLAILVTGYFILSRLRKWGIVPDGDRTSAESKR